MKDAEQRLSRTQTATLAPSQEEQQARQRLELQLQQLSELRKVLVFDEVEGSDLRKQIAHETFFGSFMWTQNSFTVIDPLHTQPSVEIQISVRRKLCHYYIFAVLRLDLPRPAPGSAFHY